MKKLISLLLACLLAATCLTGLCFAADAEASWTDGTSTMEGTMEEVMAKASAEGGTVKMLKDYEMDDPKKGYAITCDSSFTLDLNGHILTSASRGLRVTGKGIVGTTIVTDSVGGGAIMSELLNMNIEAGGLILRDAMFWALTQQNIAYYDTTGDWNDVNLVENCTLVNSAWGAFAYNRTDGESMEKCKMTFKNSTLINAKMEAGPVIVVQGKAQGAMAELGEGLRLCTYANNKDRAFSQSLKLSGEEVTLAEGRHTIRIPGLEDREYPDLYVWTTSGADLDAPAGTLSPDAPAEPEKPAEPDAPTETEKPVEDVTPAEPAPAEAGGVNVGVIIGIAAAVVVIAVAVMVVAKKKKQ